MFSVLAGSAFAQSIQKNGAIDKERPYMDIVNKPTDILYAHLNSRINKEAINPAKKGEKIPFDAQFVLLIG
jgi:hypothetical protein